MSTSFTLWHPDALLVGEQPELFLCLEATPIVFTVRGLRLFRPRFALLGISLHSIRTKKDFQRAWHRWELMEEHFLVSRLSKAAQSPKSPEHAELLRMLLD